MYLSLDQLEQAENHGSPDTKVDILKTIYGSCDPELSKIIAFYKNNDLVYQYSS